MGSFNRLEGHESPPTKSPQVKLSFDTSYRGTWQCKFGRSGIDEYAWEPPFHTLKLADQEMVRHVGAIVFKMTYGYAPEP